MTDPPPAALAEQPAAVRRPRLASSSALMLVSQLGASILSLGNVLVIARALGPTGRGQVVFLIAMSTIVANLAALGVQEANVNLATDRRLRPALVANSFGFAAILGSGAAAVTAALVLAVHALGAGIPWSLLGLALSAVPVSMLNFYLWRLLQADYRFRLTTLAWLVPPVVNVGGSIALWSAGELSPGRAFGTWYVGQGISTLLLAWYALTRFGVVRPDLAVARTTLAFGLKSHLGRMMLLGNYRLDQWFMGSLAGARDLGLYSVAVAWAESLFMVPAALALAQRPDLVRAPTGEAGRKAAIAFRVGVLVTVAGAIASALLAPWLVVGLFGDDFADSVVMLRILVFGAFGVVAVKVLGNALTAQRRPLLESAASAVGLVCTIVLDVLLIPTHGGVGASIASVAAYTVAGAASAALLVRTLRTPYAELVPRVADLRLTLEVGRRLAGRRP